jgi:predicted transcriptional regulator
MRVLLSIRPPHVANILAGTKTFEFRRRMFARTDIKFCLIYCTLPVAKLVGEFEILGVIQDHPSRLWNKTRHGSGITKAYFDEYFSGRNEGFALKIGRVRRFPVHIDPAEIVTDFTPPQSYRYFPEDLSGAA